MPSKTVFVKRQAWRSATPRLLLICMIYSLGSMFFGYDGTSLAGVQAFQPYAKQFGKFNKKLGYYALPPTTASWMNSLPQAGKLVGTLVVGPLIVWLGHKKAMVITCIIQLIGVTIQCTSKHPIQFTAGRIIIYAAVGLVENIVPTYQAEISPAPLRAFFVGAIDLFLLVGALVAALANNALSKYRDQSGWIIATALQALPVVLILIGLPFTPNSPRWLVSKDRAEEALKVLNKVRTEEDIANGIPRLEVAAIVEDNATTMRKAPWKELFNRKNVRRTMTAATILAFHQGTGQSFSSAYGPTFYKTVGLSSEAFLYTVLGSVVPIVTCMCGMICLDAFGRRKTVIVGMTIMSLFLWLIGGLGSSKSRSAAHTNGMIASFILFPAAYHGSLAPAAFTTAAEVGTAALREKTMALATAVKVVVGFAVVFSIPYLLSPSYADLGSKTGFIFAGITVLAVLWAVCLMPELKGRNLEEIDQLFDAKLPAWKFSTFDTVGLTHEVAVIGSRHPKADAAGTGIAIDQQVEDITSISVQDKIS